ncbi:MAG: hypothetical protein CFE33_05780 [Pseudorhodobacter sp. PARRP1]|nr:MAG: hypothetical protein CFE33_05780 [Pseudorhodobacter sp. PARRP1]
MIGALFLLALMLAGAMQAPAWVILPCAAMVALISRFIPLIGRLGWLVRGLFALGLTAMAYGFGASLGARLTG